MEAPCPQLVNCIQSNIQSCSFEKQAEEEEWGGEEGAMVAVKFIRSRWWPPLYHGFLLLWLHQLVMPCPYVHPAHLLHFISIFSELSTHQCQQWPWPQQHCSQCRILTHHLHYSFLTLVTVKLYMEHMHMMHMFTNKLNSLIKSIK